jgi:serine/threonine protein kinase
MSHDHPHDLESGVALGNCVIEEGLGRGGMGVVYRGRQPALNRPVAVKVIHPELADNPEARERFLREARAAAAIDHPNVLPLYEIGMEGDVVFVAMRYVPDGDLGEYLTHARPTAAESVAIVLQIAAALDAAHAAGIVHRDVKPQNILVSIDQGATHAYLTDFGLARRLDQVGLTLPGALLGTPIYMSPEQALGETVDARTDVYALGCVLFELLTGDPPYTGETLTGLLIDHQSAPIPRVSDRLPHVPTEMNQVIARALAKDPNDRFPSAGDLAEAAAAALESRLPTDPERSVATGSAAARDLGLAFPSQVTRLYIQSQAPRMTPERFDDFLDYLGRRGWTSDDLVEIVHPWAPKGWSTTR